MEAVGRRLAAHGCETEGATRRPPPRRRPPSTWCSCTPTRPTPWGRRARAMPRHSARHLSADVAVNYCRQTPEEPRRKQFRRGSSNYGESILRDQCSTDRSTRKQIPASTDQHPLLLTRKSPTRALRREYEPPPSCLSKRKLSHLDRRLYPTRTKPEDPGRSNRSNPLNPRGDHPSRPDIDAYLHFQLGPPEHPRLHRLKAPGTRTAACRPIRHRSQSRPTWRSLRLRQSSP